MTMHSATFQLPPYLFAVLFALWLSAGTVEASDPQKDRPDQSVSLKTSIVRELFTGMFSKRAEEQPQIAAPFELGRQGCPMAHCDAQMTDDTRQTAPREAVLIHHSNPRHGSWWGLGCVSNGTLAACTFARSLDALEVYDYDGMRLWGSGEALNEKAWTSAPIIDQTGHVIVADNLRILRFDEAGQEVWGADMPGSSGPVSPVIGDSGVILAATKDGMISTFHPEIDNESLDTVCVSWNEKGDIILQDRQPDDKRYYITVNTPSFNRAGSRAFVLMLKKGVPGDGALVALNVTQSGQLSLGWAYKFHGPSGASPLVLENVKDGSSMDEAAVKTVIYFDGCYDLPDDGVWRSSEILAVEDLGDEPALLWRYEEAPASTSLRMRRKTIQSSFAADPRGCMWFYASAVDRVRARLTEAEDPSLTCLAYEDGQPMMTFTPGCLVGGCNDYYPSSAVSMARNGVDGTPVLIFNLSGVLMNNERPVKIVAVSVDLDGSSRLLWSFDLEPAKPRTRRLVGHGSQGQFAILSNPDGSGGNRTVFTTNEKGLYIIGDP